MTKTLEFFEFFSGRFNNHEFPPGEEQFLDDCLSCFVASTDNVMVFQAGNFFIHFSPPNNIFKLTLDDKSRNRGDGESNAAQAEDDEKNGKDPGGRIMAEINCFAIADGGNGNGGHIDAVEESSLRTAEVFKTGHPQGEDSQEKEDSGD